MPLSEEFDALNPYAPSEVKPAQPVDLEGQYSGIRERRASLRRTAIRWFVVCGISAIPSFSLGLVVSRNQILAMILGVLIFAVGYTYLDYATALTKIRQNRLFSITLRVVYGTRIAITIIFPLALQLDMICGLFSLGVTEFLFGNTLIQTFPGALFTTLVQGVILNIVLSVYGLLIMGLVMLFSPLIRAFSAWLHRPPT